MALAENGRRKHCVPVNCNTSLAFIITANHAHFRSARARQPFAHLASLRRKGFAPIAASRRANKPLPIKLTSLSLSLSVP